MALTEYSIGLSVATLQNLVDDLGLPDPHPTPFTEWTTEYADGNGNVQGDGFPFVTWQWSWVDQSDINVLRSYCPSPAHSASVYIRTRNLSGTWSNYSAIMVWPSLVDRIPWEASKTFSILFRHLESA